MFDPVNQVPIAPQQPVQQPQNYYPVRLRSRPPGFALRQPDFSNLWGF